MHELVTEESISANQHVVRLREQEESDKSIVFQNRDGTKTIYMFSKPVKYTDADGTIKDKSNNIIEVTDTIKSEKYAYQNESNDIKTYFPKNLNDDSGILLEYTDIKIELSPIGYSIANISEKTNFAAPVSTAQRSMDENEENRESSAAVYDNVFGEGSKLRYTPMFDGVKEDIILDRYNGINEFQFRVKTNGLQLVKNENCSISLVEPLTGKVKALIDPVYVYDSFAGETELKHSTNNNTTTVQEIETDNEYLLTIIVDEEFLKNDSTVYPVYVDPTMTVMGSGDIEDVSLYSSINYTLGTEESKINKIGYTSTYYGIGRALYDFPVLEFNTDFIFLYNTQIQSASLNLYYQSITGNDTAHELSLYEFHSSWSESTVKWNNTNPGNYDNLIDSESIGGGSGYKAFDISYVIDQFKTDPDYTMDFCGLLLRANSETSGVWHKFTSSEGVSGQQPYIQITYNDSPPECDQVESGAVYYLNSSSGEYLDVYNANTADNTRLLQYSFNENANQQFKITYVSGGEYEIAPQHIAGKVLSVNASNQVIIETDCNLSRQRWYIFYRNGSYHFVNKQNNTKVMEALYGDDYVYTSNNYDYCCWELIELEVFPNDVYFIQNGSSDYYADVYDNLLDDGAQIKQYSQTVQSNQLWRFERQANSYYKIYPMHTNDRVMGLNTSNSVVSDADATTDRTQWKIEEVSENVYTIRSKYDLSKYVTVANNNEETNLIGSTYNSTYSQWVITKYGNNSVWDGGYVGLSDLTNVYYTVDLSALDQNMTSAVYAAGEAWNNISPCVNLKYVPYGTSGGSRNLLITFVASSELSQSTLAATLPSVDGNQIEPGDYFTMDDIYDDWDCCIIYVNLNALGDSVMTDNMRKQVVIHEIGHALKLSHNRENFYIPDINTARQPLYKSTFPSIMHTTTNVQSGTTYADAEDHYSSWIITNIDRSALRYKWGD